MGLQENGKGVIRKYNSMDSDLVFSDSIEEYGDLQQGERNTTHSTTRFVLTCAIFASPNFVLLGDDVGVMNGAIIFMQEDLNITEVQEEVLVGILSIISLLGSLAGGKTSDAIGRKWTMPFTAIVFQSGAAIMALAPSFQILMKGRLLAGIKGNAEILATSVVVGFTKTCSILIAIFLIDRVGRQPLLYMSTIGMTTCLLSLGFTLSFLGNSLIGIKSAILFVCGNATFFSIGIRPICWVLTSEIFPLRLRAQASTIGAAGSRVSSGVVAMSSLSVARVISIGGVFFVFAAISAFSVLFVYKCVPETKGMSLEQIEMLFESEKRWQGVELELEDVEHLVQKQ